MYLQTLELATTPFEKYDLVIAYEALVNTFCLCTKCNNCCCICHLMHKMIYCSLCTKEMNAFSAYKCILHLVPKNGYNTYCIVFAV